MVKRLVMCVSRVRGLDGHWSCVWDISGLEV